MIRLLLLFIHELSCVCVYDLSLHRFVFVLLLFCFCVLFLCLVFIFVPTAGLELFGASARTGIVSSHLGPLPVILQTQLWRSKLCVCVCV